MAELRDRLAIENKIAARLERMSVTHRRRLLAFAGEPPVWSRVPDAVWQEMEAEQREELAAVLAIVAVASAVRHGLNEPDAQAAAAAFAQARATELTRSLRADLSSATSLDEVKTVLGATRSQTIATTETTVAQSFGGEAAARRFGMTEADLWRTERDGKVCSVCGPLDRAVRSRWMARFPDGPPAHPNCRCFIEYAFDRRRPRDRSPSLATA